MENEPIRSALFDFSSPQQYYYFVYVSFFILSIIFSWLINSLFLKFVATLGIRNQSEQVVRWSSESKPAVGGFSFYILFLLSIIVFSIFFDNNKVFLSKEFIGILLSTMLGFILGMTDDSYNTKPLLKISAQITCGCIIMLTGTVIPLTSLPWLNNFITVFWVVGIMNALNMLDNMDAISGTVSLCIIMSALLVMILHSQLDSVYFMVMIGVMGAIIGFLYFNWHPSRIYMGDTGSMFLGVFLAAMGIKFLWNAEPTTDSFISIRNLLLPLIVFIMPIIDTTTVVINRISKGNSPFVGGKDHTTHALVYLGLSERKVALVFWGINLVSLFLVLVIENMIPVWSHFYTLLFVAYLILIFSIFFYAARVNK